MEEALLGVDIGTSSSKAVLAAPDGRVIGAAERRHGVSRPRPDQVEQDALEVWWADFVSLCQELIGRHNVRVLSIAVSGLGPCLLPVNAVDEPLRPAILYAVDNRARAQIEELNEQFGVAQILRRCGHPLTAQSVGPKLRWLAVHEPEVYGATARFFSSHNFIVRRLTGEYVLDHTTASMVDPLYDMARQRWNTTWADELVPGLALPQLRWPGEAVGSVRPAAAAETGIPAGTPVACGVLDFWAENVGVGAEEPGDCMLAYGTTMSISAVTAAAVSTPPVASAPGSSPGLHHVGGATAAAGALTDWARELTGEEGYADLIGEADIVPAGADGLLVLPYFAGERSPLFDPQARGVMCGLTLRHGRGHLYRAVLEATAYAVRHVFESMDATEVQRNRVVAAGGGTRARLWVQIMSDVTGVAQDIPHTTIGASYGDALLAARAIGLPTDRVDWARVVDTVRPDERVRERYAALYALYRELDPITRPVSHALDALAASGELRRQETTNGP